MRLLAGLRLTNWRIIRTWKKLTHLNPAERGDGQNMMADMGRYSEVYPAGGENQSGYRYNYTHNVLEYVSKVDSFHDGSGKLITLFFMDWVVLGAVGLCQREWSANPQYWVDHYSCVAGENASHAAQAKFTPRQNARNYPGLRLVG